MIRIVIFDVPNEGKTCLGRCVWEFVYFDDRGLVLERYAEEERETARHKYRARREHQRLGHHRKMYLHDLEQVAEADVPLPDWVKARALEEFTSKVKVVKWGDKR